MNETIINICDNLREAEFARAILQQNGFQNIQVKQAKRFKVFEVVTTTNPPSFAQAYSRNPQPPQTDIYLVSGEK
jgi:hypothetical protein